MTPKIIICLLCLFLIAGSPIEPEFFTPTVTPDIDIPGATPPYTAIDVVSFQASSGVSPLSALLVILGIVCVWWAILFGWRERR